MVLPGYTAHVSLHRSAIRYRVTAQGGGGEGGVTPSQIYAKASNDEPYCIPITVDGKVSICCCDGDGSNCVCTGIV